MADLLGESSNQGPPRARLCAGRSGRPRGASERSELGVSEIVADLLGESSNLLDDLFKDLEDWEAILSSLPEFGVDQNPDSTEPQIPEAPEPG